MGGYNLTARLDRFQSYDEALREFHPQSPENFNIADAICRNHSDSVSRIAVFEEKTADDNLYTFGALDYLSNKFANVLSSHRIRQGDRVAVMLPQSVALLVAHLGILKVGGIVTPLAPNSPEAIIEYTLKVISPRALIISSEEIDRVMNSATSLSSIESIFIASDFRSRTDFGSGYKSFWRETYNASPDFTTVETSASTPAFIFPPSSTEDMKCVVHAHQLLIGQMPAFEMANDFPSSDGTIFYTSSSWSDMAVLFGMLYPALACGAAVVAGSDANQNAMIVMERRAVTNLFLSPEGLNQLFIEKSSHDLKLKNIIVSNLFDQSIEQVFDTKLSHVYTTRETGTIAASCHRWFPSPSGSQGRAIPGSRVEVTNSEGTLLSVGTPGKIAAHKSTASLCLGYLDETGKIFSALTGDWFITNDMGWKDKEENLWIKK
jgi:acetyl-CoA synthetase